MSIIPIPLAHLHLAWPALWPLLEPAVRRSKDRPDVLAALHAHDAQLWAVVDPSDDLRTGEGRPAFAEAKPLRLRAGRPVAAVVTKVQEHEGVRRCLLWLVGGSRVREWAPAFIAHIEPWARALGCVALWGTGRTGWARIAPRLGGVRIEDHEGLPAWERRIA